MDLRPVLSINRNIGKALTKILQSAPVSPNHLTLLSLVSGSLAGYAFARGTHAGLLWGAFFLHAAFILDTADGELARLRGKSTSSGALLDLACDFWVEMMSWTGLMIGCLKNGFGFPAVFVGIAAILGSISHTALVRWEQKKGIGPAVHVPNAITASRKESSFFSVLDILSDGQSSWLVWPLAFIGNPLLLFSFGAGFIHLLWITRLSVNWPVLSELRPVRRSWLFYSPRD